ncbi:MAG: lipopolysaccharide biosynthesis protein [Rhizobiales bacterium]|nr:lipopolysaccharide biosynthesis protein [Hyphomicrobiales bacterium]
MDDGALDLRALGRAIAARRWWILGPTLAAFLAMLAFVTVAKPRYTAEAKVFLENQESYYTRPDKAERDLGTLPDAEAVQSQVQLITSRDLARQAIKQLSLAGNPEFDPVAGGFNPLTRILVLLGMQRDPLTMSPEDRILESYYDKLSAFQVPRTRVITIEFTSRDPDLAARAANVIADLYIGLRSNAKKDDARTAGVWLSSSIAELRQKVEQAEGKVEAFRASNGLLVGANNTTINSQQLAELNTQLSSARSAQSESRAKAGVIRDLLRQGRIFEIPDVAKDELIRRIAEQRVTLRAQLALESRTMLPGHPRIKELQAQISDIETELRAAADKTARSLENEAKLAGGRVDNLVAALDAQKREVAVGNGEEVQLRALEREAKSAREQLESYLARYREATAREGANSTPADARIISRATAPQLPSFPKKAPLLALAALGGLILSSGVVVTRELLAAPVARRREDGAIDEPSVAGGTPVFARLPEGEREADAPGLGEPQTLARAAPRMEAQTTLDEICARIVGMGGVGAGRLLVTGARNRPTAHTALRLARALSERGRAILIDLTGESPVKAAQADPERALPGLGDVLNGEATFADVIHRDLASRLHVLPSGAPIADDEGLMLALDALDASYDHVVVAVAPATGLRRALDLAPAVDASVLVGSMADADRADIDTVYAQLRAVSAGDVLVVDVSEAMRRGAAQRDAA